MDENDADDRELDRREADEQRWSRWMARANRGDADAYRSLMAEIGDVIEAYLRARFGSVDFIEDCVQECLLGVHRARGSYDERRAFRPWLFTLVRHKAIDLIRRRNVRSREIAGSDHLADTAHGPLRDPGTAIEGARLLARIEPRYREAVALTKYAGYSVAEAAEKTGTTRIAMKNRVHRGLKALRKLLEQEDLVR